MYAADVPVDRRGNRRCPICSEGGTPWKAAVGAAVYATAAGLSGIGAWASSGTLRIVLVVIAILLGALAAWIVLFVGAFVTLIRVARGAAREEDP